MHHTTRDILGEAAYLRRSGEILLGQLSEIGSMAVGTERLTPIQEAAVADAHVDQAERAKEHLELTGQYLQGRRLAINEALAMEPSWER